MGRYGVSTGEPMMVSGWLIYNDNNLQVKSAGWDNQSNQSLLLEIFDNGILVYTDTLEPGVGERNVPGNHKMQEVTDVDGNPHLILPAGITMRLSWPA